jgi:hypothetical protein
LGSSSLIPGSANGSNAFDAPAGPEAHRDSSRSVLRVLV